MVRFILLLLASSVCVAQELPALNATELFKSLKGCTSVDFGSWNHPTKSLLIQKGAKLEKVQLCNNKRYPVFYVDFPYDPQGQTKDYFLPLYAEMKKANGGWPYSFVATSDNTIISIKYGKKSMNVDYEMYAP